MTRIEKLFASVKRPLFIGFTVAGDPGYEGSLAAAEALIESGVDILEIGIPFSDPVADGPIIQRADTRALEAGATPDMAFAIVRHLRSTYKGPIVFLTYYNLVYRRGAREFYRDAAGAGVDGILIADMPVEESKEVLDAAREFGIDPIFMVSETTSDDRLETIVRSAGGFLYLVSHQGVTGMIHDLPAGIPEFIGRVRAKTGLPLAVGFGISTTEHASYLYRAGADAVIAGSRIVSVVEESGDDLDRMKASLCSYVHTMKCVAEGHTRYEKGLSP